MSFRATPNVKELQALSEKGKISKISLLPGKNKKRKIYSSLKYMPFCDVIGKFWGMVSCSYLILRFYCHQSSINSLSSWDSCTHDRSVSSYPDFQLSLPETIRISGENIRESWMLKWHGYQDNPDKYPIRIASLDWTEGFFPWPTKKPKFSKKQCF